MTKKEVAYVLGYSEYVIMHDFEAAAKSGTPMGEQIKKKSKNYNKMNAVNFTLEEVLYAMQFNKVWNPAMKQYLIENFIDRPTPTHDRTHEIRYINQDAVNFYNRYVKNPGVIYCCNTCAFCIPQQPNKAGAGEHPFCNFHDKFIAKMGMNVYKDKCPTILRDNKEPRFWEADLPIDFKGFGGAVRKRFRRKIYLSRRDDDYPV